MLELVQSRRQFKICSFVTLKIPTAHSASGTTLSSRLLSDLNMGSFQCLTMLCQIYRLNDSNWKFINSLSKKLHQEVLKQLCLS